MNHIRDQLRATRNLIYANKREIVTQYVMIAFPRKCYHYLLYYNLGNAIITYCNTIWEMLLLPIVLQFGKCYHYLLYYNLGNAIMLSLPIVLQSGKCYHYLLCNNFSLDGIYWFPSGT